MNALAVGLINVAETLLRNSFSAHAVEHTAAAHRNTQAHHATAANIGHGNSTLQAQAGAVVANKYNDDLRAGRFENNRNQMSAMLAASRKT